MRYIQAAVHAFKRWPYMATMLALASAMALPMFAARASAYTQLSPRSIQLSEAAASATGVSYLVSFTATTAARNITIDFCDVSPIYGDSCAGPSGFDASGASFTNGSGVAGWSLTATTSQIQISNSATFTPGAISFTLGNITNPTAPGSFYARIYTYTAQASDYVNATNPGTVADFGGIAMSTANTVGVTARVQEEISFCVSGAAMSSNCGGMTTPSLTIGHGSPTLIVDGSQVDSTQAFTQTSTNAQSGVSIRMRNSNTCGGLSDDGGTTCNLPAAGATAITFVAGTADYGMNVADSTGGVGLITATAPYNQSAAPKYAMDTTAGSGVTSTYGSQIASSSGATSNANNTLTFAAAASNTTPAGIYTATMTLIATGTF